jgi:RNA polymerase sigma-32 factor
MARTTTLPILTAEPGLTHYLKAIGRFPMLGCQEEHMLAKRWREHGDRDAAHKLVTSHLRLVTKIAKNYRGYGLPISEAISEGNVGLIQAVERFEPEKGVRLATCAVWWIKASIQEYVLRSCSLVKMGTTANQKRAFFNLRKAQSKISILAAIREDGDSGEWQDWLVDESPDQETTLAASEEFDNRRKMLSDALTVLNERERRIFETRRLAGEPITLAELAGEFGVSREPDRGERLRDPDTSAGALASNPLPWWERLTIDVSQWVHFHEPDDTRAAPRTRC